MDRHTHGLVKCEATAKTLTREETEQRQAKAVAFVRKVLRDDDRAAEIEDEIVDEYAERKGIEIVSNPPERRKVTMARKRVMSREELMDRIDQLEEENSELQEKLDDIGSILEEAEPEEDENGD